MRLNMLFKNLSPLIHNNTQNIVNADMLFTTFKENLEQFDRPGALPTVSEANLNEIINWAEMY